MEDKVGETSNYQCWSELMPDALGLIFRRLSLQEILTVVPSVCKSWRKVVLGPYCWQEIDIYDWSIRYWGRTEEMDRMLQMLVTRSCGSFRKLCIHGLPSDLSFEFIANHAGALQTLRLTRGEMSDSIVKQVADKLANLIFLDLTYCAKIGAEALEAFGKHCKSLSTLRRVMHPSELDGKGCQDDEAHAIATTMPKLKHLEISYMVITTGGVLEILSHCGELQILDIRGCWDVKLDENFMKRKHPNVNVLGPDVEDCYDWSYNDYLLDYSDYSAISDGSDDGQAWMDMILDNYGLDAADFDSDFGYEDRLEVGFFDIFGNHDAD